jgi:hypothetical protein
MAKNRHEMIKYMKQKDFQILVKQRIHLHFNRMMVNQFNFENDRKENKLPELVKSFFTKQDKSTEENPNIEKFYFYTDATGNNHPVVRLILKRRPWL